MVKVELPRNRKRCWMLEWKIPNDACHEETTLWIMFYDTSSPYLTKHYYQTYMQVQTALKSSAGAYQFLLVLEVVGIDILAVLFFFFFQSDLINQQFRAMQVYLMTLSSISLSCHRIRE